MSFYIERQTGGFAIGGAQWCWLCEGLSLISKSHYRLIKDIFEIGSICNNCASYSVLEFKKMLEIRLDRIRNEPGYAERLFWMTEQECINLINTSFESLLTDRKSAGYVYLVGSPDGYCKIGKTVALDARMSQLAIQLPFRIELIGSRFVGDRHYAERWLHAKFAKIRMNGEWFCLSESDILWFKDWDGDTSEDIVQEKNPINVIDGGIV